MSTWQARVHSNSVAAWMLPTSVEVYVMLTKRSRCYHPCYHLGLPTSVEVYVMLTRLARVSTLSKSGVLPTSVEVYVMLTVIVAVCKQLQEYSYQLQ